MRTTTAILAGVMAGTIGLLAARGVAQRPEPPTSPVAFVNLNRVFDGYKAVKSLEEALNSEAEKLKSDMDRGKKEITEAMNNLNAQREPGTPEYETEQRGIRLKMESLKIDQEMRADALRRKEVRGMDRIYREIVAEAERIATERGFRAVLNVDDEPIKVEEKGQVINRNDLKLQMALRVVLWDSPESDLTGAVLEALNKQ